MILGNARVVTPQRILDPGWVEVDGGRIVYAGAAAPAVAHDVIDLAGAWLLPGFVDLHLHGGGGADVTRAADDMAAAVAFHRRHGTTRALVSLMAQPVAAMCEQLEWAAELTLAGEIGGVHLEGPFLAAARCGAQRPESLLQPDLPLLRKLLEAGQGSVRTVTVAPELPGALDLISHLVTDGVVAAIGHTDASYEQAAAGFAAGATLATHLFNAMGSIDQRAPGPSIAALDAGVAVELINDGVHVHDALSAWSRAPRRTRSRSSPMRSARPVSATATTPSASRTSSCATAQARLAGVATASPAARLTMDEARAPGRPRRRACRCRSRRPRRRATRRACWVSPTVRVR